MSKMEAHTKGTEPSIGEMFSPTFTPRQQQQQTALLKERWWGWGWGWRWLFFSLERKPPLSGPSEPQPLDFIPLPLSRGQSSKHSCDRGYVFRVG